MDWNAIKSEYATSNISYRDLSKKHGVPFTTLAHRAKQERWSDLRRRHNDNIVTKMVAKKESQAINYKSKLYKIAYSVANQLDEIIKGSTIDDLLAKGIKIRDITGAIKDLEDALHIKSEGDMAEQEARIKALEKRADAEDTAQEITITIDGGEKYSE